MRRASRCACVLALAALSGSWLAGCDDGSENQDEHGDLSDRKGSSGRAGGDSFAVRAFATAGDAGVSDPDGASEAASDSPDGATEGSSDSVATGEDAGLDYSDEEIVALVAAIHESQTTLGRAGQRDLTEPRLKSLAADVTASHEEGRLRALTLGILPLPSKQSVDYVESGRSLRTNLRRQEPGEPFDRAYLESQVMLNAIVIHHIGSMWLPLADRSPELQAELTTTRETMQGYLDRAVALRTELFPAGAAPLSDGADAEPAEPIEPEEPDAPSAVDAGIGEPANADAGSESDAAQGGDSAAAAR